MTTKLNNLNPQSNSKIEFYYGTMNASKSANLLMQAFNEEQNGQPWLIKPSTDNRSKMGLITTRANIESKLADDIIHPDTSFNEIIQKYEHRNDLTTIYIDEAQFLKPKQVKALCQLARLQDINIKAFGLLKNFKNELFPGSQEWVQQSDSLIEIKTQCHYPNCQRKAECTAKIINEKLITTGLNIDIGAEEKYTALCQYHYQTYNQLQNQEL